MSVRLRLQRPPATLDSNLNIWLDQLTDSVNQLPAFSLSSTTNGPNSNTTGDSGTLLIDYGSSYSTFWLKLSGSTTTGWNDLYGTIIDSATTNASSLVTGNLPYAQLPTGGGTWVNGGALSITGGALTITDNLQLSQTKKVTFDTDLDTYIWKPSDAVLEFWLQGIEKFQLDSNGVTFHEDMAISGQLNSNQGAAANSAIKVKVTGDTFQRLFINGAGDLGWGPGGAANVDVYLYRESAAQLFIENNLRIRKTLTVGTTAGGAGFGDIIQLATGKHYYDGEDNTYRFESADDVLDDFIGGVRGLRMAESGGVVTMTIPIGLTGIVRADAGVLSIATGVGDKVLFDHFVDANNGTTLETDLYSDTIPAARLAANGEKLVEQFAGIITGDATSTQRLRVYFGAGTLIFDSGAVTFGVTVASWNVCVTIIRVSSSVVRCSVALSTSFASLAAYVQYTEVTGLTLANTQILKITGTAAGATGASNQITAKESYIQWLPAA